MKYIVELLFIGEDDTTMLTWMLQMSKEIHATRQMLQSTLQVLKSTLQMHYMLD
jgi:hypothetical protein